MIKTATITTKGSGKTWKRGEDFITHLHDRPGDVLVAAIDSKGLIMKCDRGSRCKCARVANEKVQEHIKVTFENGLVVQTNADGEKKEIGRCYNFEQEKNTKKIDDDLYIKMRPIKVTFMNGETLSTHINGTMAGITSYYLNGQFNLTPYTDDIGVKEELTYGAKVEFLDKEEEVSK